MPNDAITTDNRGYTLVRKALNQSEVWDWFAEYLALWVSVDTDVQSVADEGVLNTQAIANRKAATLEWSGFSDGGDNSSIGVSYDPVARTVTLTGTFVAYYHGTRITELVDGWESAAHGVGPTAALFLKYNGAGFTWSSTPWNFHETQIAYVCYNAAGEFCFAQREVHGFMPWSSHKRFHTAVGTTREAGGDLSGYIVGSTAAVNRRPDTSACTLLDEDLASVLAAHASGDDYTYMYLAGAAAEPVITKGSTDIVGLAGASLPYWNEYTGGAWVQSALSNGDYMNVWEIAVPVSQDSDSQKARFIWMAGQVAYGSLALAQAAPVHGIDFGGFSALSPEFNVITKVTLQYQGSDWTIQAVERIEESRAVAVSNPSGTYLSAVNSTDDFSGSGTASDPLALTIEPTLDGVTANNNKLSRTIDVQDGDITGVLGGAKAFDAVSTAQLKNRTLALSPVSGVLNAPPTPPVVGNRYLVGVGTGAFLGHNGEIVEVVSRKPNPAAIESGGTTLLLNNKSLAHSPDQGIYVAVASDGFSYSYDGLTYVAVAPPSVENWTRVIHVKPWRLFIACNTTGTTFSFATCTDGKNWVGRVGPVKAYKGLAYLPETDEVFAASSDGTPRLSYTSDGTAWDDTGVVITEESWTVMDYSFKHKKLVCSNTSGTTNQFGYSSNGRAWSYSSPGAQSWESIRAFKGRVGMCSLGDTNRFTYTDDLVNWVSVLVTASDENAWKGFDYGGGILFMVAASGAAAYSLNYGDNWTIVTTETTDFRDAIWAQSRGEFAAIGRTGTYRSLITGKITDYLFKLPQNGNSVYVQSIGAYYEHINNTWIQPTNRPVLTDYGKANLRAVYVAKTNTTDTGTDSASMTMVTGSAEFLEAFDLNKAYLLDVELMVMMLDTSYTAATTIWHGKALRAPYTGDSPTFVNLLTNNDAGYGATVFNVAPVFVWGSSGLEVTVEHTGGASRTYDAVWQLSVRLQYLDDGEPVC